MEPRLIKRYSNRKLYDTSASRYVKLDDILQMVMDGEDVKIIDNNSGRDLSGITMAQILFEELKKKKGLVSFTALKNLLRLSGGSISELLEELFSPDSPLLAEIKGKGRKKLDEIYSWLDKKIESTLPGIAQISAMKEDFRVLKEKVEYLEKELSKLKKEARKYSE
jgi:polyhydroxyalkanoate synthesis repressor PhaR